MSGGTATTRHAFFTGNGVSTLQSVVAHTTSAVNYLQATGSATGSGVTLSAQGSDTNIDINLVPKGTGSVVSSGSFSATSINNTVIGNITPAAGTFTTITGQTATINGTGQNLVANSQTIGGTGWGNIGTTTATINTAVAPDSTTTASTITGASNIAYNTNNTIYAVSVTPSTLYTFSCYVKFGTATTVSIGFRDNFTGADISVANTTASNWTRISVSYTSGPSTTSVNLVLGGANGTFFAWGAQANTGATATAYIATAGAITLGNPYIAIGTALIGVTSTGALYVQPAGTGALQAQATTSSATGGNARGANAVDLQMARGVAASVASATQSVIAGGFGNAVTGTNSFVGSGVSNGVSGSQSVVVGGNQNSAGNQWTFVCGGFANSAQGVYNFIGCGSTNSGTASAAATTQSATMNGTTAVTLAAPNANIKVGQVIVGTNINAYQTYVAAVSGTSLTLSLAATGSGTSTLSFYTPHGVVVGGGNNQATGSYSFIGGGGDAGTASNRNVASGDWSVVAGGLKSVASGQYAFVGGGSGAIASGAYAVVSGGVNNQATGFGSTSIGGYNNISNSAYSATLGGNFASTRGIEGISVFGSQTPLGGTLALAQSSLLVLAVQTTDATATVLRSNASAASTTNQIILPNNAAFAFKGTVIANVTGAANGAAWEFTGAIMRGANAASTVLMGTPVINRVAATAGATAWAIAITADTTNGGLAVTVTGAASTTIRWVCKAETTEVTF